MRESECSYVSAASYFCRLPWHFHLSQIEDGIGACSTDRRNVSSTNKFGRSG